MHILLATFNLLPEGEPGGALVVAALADRGIDARWMVWDDPAVDWAAADLVAVRSTWDYHRRWPEFRAWARRVEQETPLLNGAAAFEWNGDKAYLLALGELVPVVPTALLEDAGLRAGLSAALARFPAVVVKPRTGAGGVGVVIAESTDDLRLEGLTAGPWVVQPLVESVRTRGEVSVYVLGGRAVSQVDKVPGAGEIRVHELYGGGSRAAALGSESARLAEAAVAAAGDILGDVPAYARVDLMWWADRWAVSELELIEPGLYLDVVPANAAAFADLVASRL